MSNWKQFLLQFRLHLVYRLRNTPETNIPEHLKTFHLNELKTYISHSCLEGRTEGRTELVVSDKRSRNISSVNQV